MPETIGVLIITAVASAEAAAATFTIVGVTISYASIVGAVVLAAAEFAISSLLTPSPKSSDGERILGLGDQGRPALRRAGVDAVAAVHLGFDLLQTDVLGAAVEDAGDGGGDG